MNFQSTEGLVLKKHKEHHPASQRVAEAAEYLMFVLFEHKVSFQSKLIVQLEISLGGITSKKRYLSKLVR